MFIIYAKLLKNLIDNEGGNDLVKHAQFKLSMSHGENINIFTLKYTCKIKILE